MPHHAHHRPAPRQRHAGGRGRLWQAEPRSPGLLHLRLRGAPGSGELCIAPAVGSADSACAQVFQISVSSTYGVADFKENLLALYSKAGTRGIPITFLLTDNQIVNEKFLVYINDLLSTGYVADLCTPVRAYPAHSVHVSGV